MENVLVRQTVENLLGEGLFISAEGEFWLDIMRSELFVKLNNKPLHVYSLPEQASAIWKVVGSLVYLATESGISTFDRYTKCWTVVAALATNHNSSMRANDGCAIDNDFYFFGTMEKKPTRANGSLYLFDGDSLNQVYSGIGIPNTFVRLGKYTFLISDSLKQIIYKFTFSSQFTDIEKKEVWLDLSMHSYTPDGGCIDEHGNIYIAMWDGNAIHKYNIYGDLLNVYKVPVPRPTNCKLSMDKKSLLVTTARESLSRKELMNSPLSGALLTIKLLA
jgi:sugar lactone lactonase YvrE